jgi:hypothetical protein
MSEALTQLPPVASLTINDKPGYFSKPLIVIVPQDGTVMEGADHYYFRFMQEGKIITTDLVPTDIKVKKEFVTLKYLV